MVNNEAFMGFSFIILIEENSSDLQQQLKQFIYYSHSFMYLYKIK